MEVSKKRSGDSVKSGSPKKQRTGAKAQGGKGKKDPNKPKRPKTAYLHFMDHFRAQRKNEGQDKSTKIADVARDGGIAWAKMDDKEKQPYLEKYKQEKSEYDKKMCLFKPAKDQNKPKRPMTSFLFFLEQYREIKKAEGLKGPEVSKRAGEEWRCMPGEKKKKYLDLQEKAKEKFDEEMKEWIAKNPAPPPQKKAKKSKAKVQEESESEEEDEDEEEEEEEDDDEEEEEEDDDEEESD